MKDQKMSALTWTDDQMALGNAEIDQAHRELVDLINIVAEANKETFPKAFTCLVSHTREHFEFEQKLMDRNKDPKRQEHKRQHTKLIGELLALEHRVKRGQYKLARSFVTERLPEWLYLHTTTMDSMLVTHLNQNKIPNKRL
ncbi:MAG: hemerythrin family protein [Hyphomicrobiaceae bacterium]|nr:hemerythrin family protein [Hyphomicrobiaceae bacterium]